MANTEKVTPQQAAQYFAQMTRQNLQMLPATAGAESSTITFNLPKVRLTSKIRVMVEAVLTATHASATSYTPATFGPYELIRKVSIDMNNGFSPFSVSGKQLYMISLLDEQSNTFRPATTGRGRTVQGVTSSTGGAPNTIRFMMDLPLTLNDREPIGLVLTQNQETTVTVTIDTNNAASLLASTTGYTLALSNFVFTPMVESFAIPALAQAFPDLSILKLVQAASQTISGSGEQTFKLPTGQTYRKLAFLIENSSGGVADTDLAGNIELVFNQADTPYKVSPKMLAAINHSQYGQTLPNGMYAFDFTYQGTPNYGGSRDYVDTERLTEFWLKFNAAAAGNVTVVYETLSQLKQSV
jgi:hypothetical protein